MSQENVELVREAVEASNAFMRGEGTREALAEYFDPRIDFDWHEGRTFPDEPQHLRGGPDFMTWMEDVREAMDEFSLEPLEFIDAPDDRVLVPFRQTGRGRESGVPIETHFFEVVTIRDGKVGKIDLFRHRADALEAAGLRE